MITYIFKWKVVDGLGLVTRGEDTIKLEDDTTQEELEEEISEAISTGDDEVFGQTLMICTTANQGDAGCNDWKIFKMKRVKKI